MLGSPHLQLLPAPSSTINYHRSQPPPWLHHPNRCLSRAICALTPPYPPPDACRKGRCCTAAAAAGLFAGQLLSAAAAALVPYALSSVLPLALTAALQSFLSPVSTLVACLGPYVNGTQHCILSLGDSMMDYTRVHPLLSPTYWQRDASLLARTPGTLISSLLSIPSPFFHSVQRTPPFCSCSACTNLWGAGCLPPRISV